LDCIRAQKGGIKGIEVNTQYFEITVIGGHAQRT
jgi:hypothetical protein